MMKNKVQIMGAGLLALLLVFAGCSNPLGERPDASPDAVSGGKIVVTLGGLDARTLGPMADDVDGLQYRLVLYNDSKIIGEDIDDFTQPVEYSIEAGEWTVAVLAYTEDENDVAWGEESSVKVLAGGTYPVFITLLPVTYDDAYGIFDYAVEFPDPTDDFGYASTILKLTPPSESTNSGGISINLRDPNKDAAKLELPAGKYTLTIALTSTRKIQDEALKVAVTEVVYLYPGLTTQAHYNQANKNAFTLADFGADVYLKGTADVANNTELGADGNPLVNYIPTKVQLKLYDDGDPDDTNFEEEDITLNQETGEYEWELLIPSEKISGANNVSQIKLSLVIADAAVPDKPLFVGAQQTIPLEDVQGHRKVSLTASVFSILKGANAYFAATGTGITGVSGIAYDKHAMAGMPVELRIVPATNYGVIGANVEVRDVSSSSISRTVASDGIVSFTMPSSGNVTVNANFYRLAGTATISSDPYGYVVTKVEAWGDVKNEETGAYDWELIGETSTIANSLLISNGWEIGFKPNYVYTGIGSIRLKLYMAAPPAQNQPAMDWTTTVSVSSLTGTQQADLTPTLNTVSYFRQTGAALTSVTLSWDNAAWATGFNIYRGATKITPTPLAAGTTFYTDTGLTAGTSYYYTIRGIYGVAPGTEGTMVSVTAYTQLAAPQSVNVAIAAGSSNPFQTYITWDPVTGRDHYDVYRNGTLVNTYNVTSTGYYDTAYKALGEEYVYTVVAKGASGRYDITSADSDQTPIDFPVMTGQYGNIDSTGTFNYHRFTASSAGSYYLSFDTSGPYTLYAYAFVYVNGSLYTSYSFYGGANVTANKAGDEIIVVVRANDFSSTGNYYINISQ
jgi:hypothetical protein